MDESIWDDAEVQAWLDRSNAKLRPMIMDSAITMALFTGQEPDAKQAVELGFMLLLGKPLILAVVPGTPVPAGLARAADRIVEVDFDNMDEARPRIEAAVSEVMDEREAG